MTEAQIKTLIEKLGTLGFAPWYRKPGYDGWPSSEIAHIHIVWAAAPMKSSLRSQIRDFVVGKNGLASHTTYAFYKWSELAIRRVRKEFLAANPGVNYEASGCIVIAHAAEHRVARQRIAQRLVEQRVEVGARPLAGDRRAACPAGRGPSRAAG